MSFTYQGGAMPFRAWAAAHLTAMFSIVVLGMIGFIIFSEITDIKVTEDDASWAVFEMGLEHQRLQVSAAKAETVEEIHLRGDIFQSRVKILRDAPALSEVRRRMVDKDLTSLYQSAQATAQLISELGGAETRETLRAKLHADASMVRELMLDLASVNRKVNLERRIAHSNHLLFYLFALEFLTLALLGLSLLVFRITGKLRQTGRELAQQLATQDAILKTVDAAIIGIGSRGSVLYSNPAAVALLGPHAGSGASLAAGHVAADSLAADVRSLAGEAHAIEGASALRKVQYVVDGRIRHYVIRASRTLTGGEGYEDAYAPESTAHIVTVTDVTEAEQAVVQRDEYDMRLGEASRLLAYAAISGGIVHEISQPLAAIRNYVHALKVTFTMRYVNSDCRAIADHLVEEVDRAIEVVRTVRRMGPADVQDSGVCDVQVAIAHSVRLATLGCNPPPPVAICDRAGRAIIAGSLPVVGQVIVNLLRNALSASKAAGRPGAEVAVKLCDSHAVISVSDHGEGVSPDAARTMFQPFSKSARGGMGLGLAICQRIATSLGGSLSWENQDQSGAVFRFTIPLAREGSVQ